jgi:hypothetical protein
MMSPVDKSRSWRPGPLTKGSAMELNYDPRPPERQLKNLSTSSDTRPWRPYVGLGGAAAVAIGSLMPWATADTVFGSISANGFDRDGKITIGLAAIYAVLYFGKQRIHSLLAAFVAFATLIVGVLDLNNVQTVVDDINATSDGYASAHVGTGLWLVIIGAVAMLVSIFGHSTRQAEQES